MCWQWYTHTRSFCLNCLRLAQKEQTLLFLWAVLCHLCLAASYILRHFIVSNPPVCKHLDMQTHLEKVCESVTPHDNKVFSRWNAEKSTELTSLTPTHDRTWLQFCSTHRPEVQCVCVCVCISMCVYVCIQQLVLSVLPLPQFRVTS